MTAMDRDLTSRRQAAELLRPASGTQVDFCALLGWGPYEDEPWPCDVCGEPRSAAQAPAALLRYEERRGDCTVGRWQALLCTSCDQHIATLTRAPFTLAEALDTVATASDELHTDELHNNAALLEVRDAGLDAALGAQVAALEPILVLGLGADCGSVVRALRHATRDHEHVAEVMAAGTCPACALHLTPLARPEA